MQEQTYQFQPQNLPALFNPGLQAKFVRLKSRNMLAIFYVSEAACVNKVDSLTEVGPRKSIFFKWTWIAESFPVRLERIPWLDRLLDRSFVSNLGGYVFSSGNEKRSRATPNPGLLANKTTLSL